MKSFYTQMSGKTCYTMLLGLLLSACASAVLPNSTTHSQSQFETFDAAKTAFDKIEVDKTTHTALAGLGFDPTTIPNTNILNYVDVVMQFGAVFSKEDLPDGVQSCLKAREDCFGYVAQVQNIRRDTVGNVPANLLGFRKHVRTHGWAFKATLVLVDGIVVYKLWNGTPDIESFEKNSKPLGPIQNLNGLIPNPF